MVKITNTGTTPRALPIGSKKTLVEIEPGASVNMDAADWTAIKGRPSIKALIGEGSLATDEDDDGNDGAQPATDDKPKAKRGRKPKVKPEGAATDGEPDDGDHDNDGTDPEGA